MNERSFILDFMKTIQIKGEVWTLITGASRGIGRDLALKAAQAGQNLILHGRDRPALEQLAGEISRSHAVKTEVLTEDLSQSGAAERIFAETQKRGLIVDALINNAGFGSYGYFHMMDAKKDQSMLMVNVVALTELTRLFGREMVSRGHGRILNVASTAAFQPSPIMTTYFANKAYVVTFSEGLHAEWKRFGVTVTVLCPGATHTDFVKNAGMEGSRLFKNFWVSSSPEVARQGFEAMMAGKRMVIPGLVNRLLVAMLPFIPRGLVLKIAEYTVGGGGNLTHEKSVG